MAHAATFPYRKSLGLLGLVLISVCALSPQAIWAQKLTVNVTVTDALGNPIPSGTVTIKRDGGTPKTETLVNGLASISGSYLFEPDYQVTVTADGYKQSEPPTMLPVELLKAASKGDKKATLPRPIVMLPQTGPEQPTDLTQLQKQLSDLLLKHPELLDVALQHVDAQPELQQRIVAQVKAGQHSWAKSIVMSPRTLWSYWWVLALPSAFAAGLLVQKIGPTKRRSPAGGVSRRRASDEHPAVGSQVRAAPPVSTDQALNAAATGPDTLETKVERLIKQQEILVVALNNLTDRQPRGTDDGTSGAMAGDGAATQDWADATQRAGHASGPTTEDIVQPVGDFNDHAQAYYRSLVREGQISPAPKYLNAEVRSSPKDLVGDKQVFLQEVAHTQGAFVLFADDNGNGWVFPNPQLNFSQPALRPVFPQLTASNFNSSKETIVPVPVTRVSDDRWRVERKL